MLGFTGGIPTQLDTVVSQIRAARSQHDIEGITILGGEPMAHAEHASTLARLVQSEGLSVMVFTGFLLEELNQTDDPHVSCLLKHTDILVDGPYDQRQPDRERRWVGSQNQRIHFLTERYRADDPCWKQPNTLELRLRDGELTLNGFPARQAVGVWSRRMGSG
jgi:anaerobic ribonucleoside-triphosphate reductase activating protein